MNFQANNQQLDPSLWGYVVTWNVASETKTLQEIQGALKSAGLQSDSAKERSPKQAFRRALSGLREGRDIQKVASPSKAAWQFTRFEDDGQGRLDYDYEDTVFLNDADRVEANNDNVRQKVEEEVGKATIVWNAGDVTRLVQKLFSENADLYPINPRKGVAYFVPARCYEYLLKVEKFCLELGGEVWRVPVPKGDEKGDASLQNAVSQGLASKMDELEEAIKGFDDKTRKSTVDSKMKKYEEVEYKVECYADLLANRSQELLDRVKEGKEKVRQKVADMLDQAANGESTPLFDLESDNEEE